MITETTSKNLATNLNSVADMVAADYTSTPEGTDQFIHALTLLKESVDALCAVAEHKKKIHGYAWMIPSIKTILTKTSEATVSSEEIRASIPTLSDMDPKVFAKILNVLMRDDQFLPEYRLTRALVGGKRRYRIHEITEYL